MVKVLHLPERHKKAREMEREQGGGCLGGGGDAEEVMVSKKLCTTSFLHISDFVLWNIASNIGQFSREISNVAILFALFKAISNYPGGKRRRGG